MQVPRNALALVLLRGHQFGGEVLQFLAGLGNLLKMLQGLPFEPQQARGH